MLAPHELPGSFEAIHGLVSAPLDGKGHWGAINDLRAAMRELRAQGSPQVAFMGALDEEDRMVAVLDPSAAVLFLAYRLAT